MGLEGSEACDEVALVTTLNVLYSELQLKVLKVRL